MPRVVCHTAIDQEPGPSLAAFDRADAVKNYSRAGDQAASRLEVQVGESESALVAAFDHRLGDAAHVAFDGRRWQLIFVICHTPSAAGTEMPLVTEADLFCQVQCNVDRGQQWFGIAEVRTQVEVDAVD